MSSLISQIERAASSPPTDPAERLALYNAARKLSDIVEGPFDTIFRIVGSPKILTFAKVAGDLGVFKSLAASDEALTGSELAEGVQADPTLLSRILRYLSSNGLIAEVDEDKFVANNITHTLARPAFKAGIDHSFSVFTPCLQETPKFLADTKYVNPTDPLHGPFQVAHKTDLSTVAWAVQHPDVIAEFSVWMAALHDTQQTWLDVFDFRSHVAGSTPDTPIFVDVGGGFGQQSALIRKVYPQVPGRVVLQEHPGVAPNVPAIDNVETQAYDFWTEQPLKGARVYYLRNILHDYPDDKAITLIHNIVPALAADSLLIIDEIIIPNKGASSRATELDMTMLALLASAERTERQWDALLDQAGLKIVKKSTYNPATGDSVIVTVPK